ncbi:MAG: toll/interleukin-1 receptor domain-containing protein [Sphingomonadales bacterium]|nr:toll/interleukin-1 receptor domain-containing protein [Sphingomonadales bacterium]NCO50454.1 toll/interleukin-1 receptor domain-containing protein [Sphingomonadales bacterium]NCP01672.1 toll/interleukin-1 receptor domain-containing protein [Sphingomonadales bacterium]NCP28360.1 toll/interleukin-1 receptor domain-containing protein [Sphingomonadales bacterium]NCP44493.1 toll/interleukin-1 receptor domain-containing protein [Sphingomonadales bacterium]
MGETGTFDPQAVRFRAFVSYSHADAAIAQKLHRKIETYRLPHHLRAGQIAEADNGRLGRIFRDREDLSAAEDLSESVKQALAGSQVLVVICSPDAKASIWVAREIDLFRALHPGRPVLAALVRGEPEEAFPEALLHGAEPLAADLRKEGDGWRLGFLKIVAGIAGVPLDALVQRDAARRIRRVMAVTGGALVALLAMIGMTIFAIQSRNEAQHQQAEAEGLVEYMLTDLRTELKGVGRLDVMTKVNERAMDYYDDQADLSDMPAESLERRARILHAMGEDDEKRGDLDKALAKFTEAHRVTEALLAQDPDNPARIFGHAQSEYWVGYIAYLKKDWARAEKYWQGYKKYADMLVAADDQNVKWVREAGYAEGNLCTLSLQRNDKVVDAIRSCRSALITIQKIQKSAHDHLRINSDIANRHGWLADAYSASGVVDSSLFHRRKQESLLQTSATMMRKDMDLYDKWMRAQMSLADDLCRSGNFAVATQYIQQARIKALELSARDPSNQRTQHWISTIGQIAEKIGKEKCK